MKYELPNSHGLSDIILNDSALLPRADGSPSVTDIQYEALAAGVARGQSILAVAPTSTGKTNIAMWGLLSWIASSRVQGTTVVYLVSHRALARQKFDEFQSGLCEKYFGGDASAIVLATGDGVEDGTATVARNPLDAPVLVATYEKYLALLSGSGLKHDMSRVLVVCDEIQLLGEETRGRSVEVLLTLLKSANLGQLIALSAVMDPSDAKKLSDWLGLKLVYSSKREKHLLYECRFPLEVAAFDTERPEAGVQTGQLAMTRDTAGIVAELCRDKRNLPIVVFCMKVQRVHDCAKAFIATAGIVPKDNLPLFSGLNENTESARRLTQLLEHRIAFHTADLLDEERRLVESKLRANEIDVVFATTTLAAGVNFPFTTAVFDDWKRWDERKRQHLAIPNAEFQNMAGRAGRMGLSAGRGRIIFCSESIFTDRRSVTEYLNPDSMSPLKPQLTPNGFEQVVLWLLSCGMCDSASSVKDFLFRSFSASLEQSSNRAGLEHWQNKPQEVLESLRLRGFIL